MRGRPLSLGEMSVQWYEGASPAWVDACASLVVSKYQLQADTGLEPWVCSGEEAGASGEWACAAESKGRSA